MKAHEFRNNIRMSLVLLSAAILTVFVLVEAAPPHINRFSNLTSLTSLSIHPNRYLSK
jgi:hypothetical protein